MPDDDAPELDLPDADCIHRNYLETCRRLGVEPTPRDRADKPIAESSVAIAVGLPVPPTKH